MYRVQVMNKIAPAGLRRLDPGRYQVSKEETRYEGLILRSADLHGFDFPDELLAIARAGSGTNNIPIDQCNARGIAVFNTPGANANAVKELLIADLLLASRDLLGGIQWGRQQVADGGDGTKVVEKGKAAFVGPELVGKTLAAIVNLPPRKMMGLESNGMLLSAVRTEKGEEKLNLIMLDDQIPAGSKLC